MDNVTLINQARQLYALLDVAQHTMCGSDNAKFNRLESLVKRAYLRYQRRLNRCVICHQDQFHERIQWDGMQFIDHVPCRQDDAVLPTTIRKLKQNWQLLAFNQCE